MLLYLIAFIILRESQSMNSFHLFFSRFRKNSRYQYNVIKRIMDWTIILYLVVPSVVIFVFIYRSWWKATPSWMESILLPLVFLFFYCFTWFGKIRTFVLEADKVFLIKDSQLFYGIKKWGYLYSCLTNFIGTAVFICLFLPYFVVVSHWSLIQAVQLLLAVYIVRLWIILFKLFLLRIRNKFLNIVCTIFAFFIGLSIWNIFISFHPIVLLLLLMMFIFHPILYFYQIKRKSSFDQEVVEEKKAKLGFTSLILQLSMQVEKPSYSTREKPFFNRNSRRIFKKRTGVTGFLELFIKVLIRNPSYWFSYIQIISSLSVAMVLLPVLWLKISIFFFFIIILSIWCHTIWEKIMNATPIFNRYKNEDSYYVAKKWASTLLTVLAILIGLFFFYCRTFLFF